MTAPLLVIDGDSFAHRAYHAVPKTVKRKGGGAGNAVVGFANYLLRFWDAEKPRGVFVGWDTLEVPTYRHTAFAAYQSGREFEDGILQQLAILPDFVRAFGFMAGKGPGYEADDFVASAAAAEEARGGSVIVASGDRDMFQLATERTTIMFPVKGGVLERIGPAEVKERYGVEPRQVPDFIALRGDPSDRLPGAKGVGAIGAASLLSRYATLEDALQAGKFAGQADELRLYHRIATMDRTAPVPPIPDMVPDWKGGAVLAAEWGLEALAKRLADRASAPG
ncbi:MAG: 5'-3' exonuclease H3TH domain-containing protein [Bauldia sp.]